MMLATHRRHFTRDMELKIFQKKNNILGGFLALEVTKIRVGQFINSWQRRTLHMSPRSTAGATPTNVLAMVPYLDRDLWGNCILSPSYYMLH